MFTLVQCTLLWCYALIGHLHPPSDPNMMTLAWFIYASGAAWLMYDKRWLEEERRLHLKLNYGISMEKEIQFL